MITETSKLPDSILNILQLKNCPQKAIYYYYFVEATLPGKKIYKFDLNNTLSLLCIIPSTKLIITYGFYADHLVSALNAYTAHGNSLCDYYVISNLDLANNLQTLHHQVECRGFTETFSLTKNDNLEITPISGFNINIEENQDNIKFTATHNGKKVSKCETLWIGEKFAEIGGGTEDEFLNQGLFTWATGMLAKHLLLKGIQPLYILEQDNIASRKIANKIFHDTGGREFTFYIK